MLFKIDYNEFKNGNEQTRKLLIYQAIFTTFDMIAKKKKNQKPRSRKRIYQ
ncbi:hypothetical protein BSPWISOXPB_4155 [uncultured Gammaproteobacteria bacterium]|nr:hypothetical protein BSPWISOXPB_4155 [uncultured Gammaproteobacteria bacterium]